MSFIIAMPNGQILLTILIIGFIGLAVTSMGALLRIWTWKTPQSIIVLIVGAALVFFFANFVLIDSTIG